MPEEPKLAFIACNTNSEHEQQNMEPSVSGAPPLAAHPGQSGMTEAQQEQLLRAKYGGLLPKKKLGVKDAKYFDSADWALAKQKGQQAAAGPNLQPKLEPNQVPARRVSALGDGM